VIQRGNDRRAIFVDDSDRERYLSALREIAAPVGLAVTLQEDSYLPTDASSFYVRGVPILSAFTGSHSEYHTPRDTPEWATSYEKTLPSVLKAEAEAELSVRFVTQDVEPVTPARPFTPATYDDELMTAAPTPPKKAGRPRKVVESVAADDTLTED
jgi:hypothetical protein